MVQNGRQFKMAANWQYMYKMKYAFPKSQQNCINACLLISENYIIIPKTNIYHIFSQNPRWPPYLCDVLFL